MTEDLRITGDEHGAEAERELSWRAESVGLAHSRRSDSVTAHR
jgi:hypothetical protein